jgi:hypothetical protein
MHPILVIAIASAAAVPLGLWLHQDLAKLTYRIESEHDRPGPGSRWWVVWASVLSVGGVTTAATLGVEAVFRPRPLTLAVSDRDRRLSTRVMRTPTTCSRLPH